jgi:hypothetical protein
MVSVMNSQWSSTFPIEDKEFLVSDSLGGKSGP